MSRIWKYKEANISSVSKELIDAADGLPILAKLLAIRGITDPEEARAFLNLENYAPASGSSFPDMEKAIQRLQKAIEAQEHILIFGDFDVDGITGTSVLYEALSALRANVSYYVPDRHTEGHGLNTTALIRLVSTRQVKLVVSTDTGITNFNEVSLLNGLGVDTIITDHHELPEHLPPAFAILNPKLLPGSSPLIHLAGVGVAYKLCETLMASYEMPQAQIDALLDLVALGTVVDMVPLLRENRYLVWRGLDVMARRERTGIRALLLEANINETAPMTTQVLGFGLGPRLNAIGRLSNAAEAVELLTTSDEDRARQLAAKLEQLNRRRKDLVEQCLLEAERHLLSTGELTDQKAIIMASKEWNQGIVGLVATRLIDKYQRPAFLGYVDDASQEVRFSARSIESFDMHHNLQALEDLFLRWGGHAGAAGFAIKQSDLQKLKSRLFQLCAERIAEHDMIPITWVDMTLNASQINTHLVDIVNRMAPFGQNNPMPIFALEHAGVGAQRMMGEDQRHLKVILSGKEPGQYLEAVYWDWGRERAKLNANSTYRAAFTAELNTFNGSSKVQLILKDLQDESRPEAIAVQSLVAPKAMPSPQPVSVDMPETVSAVELGSRVVKSESLVTTAPIPVPELPESVQWIDHRGRDGIESFLTQVILPSTQAGQTSVICRIFCEGTQQTLPFPVVQPDFCSRLDDKPDKPAHNLIFWDLPPDMVGLVQVMRAQDPKVIHLLGSKYETIPLYRPPREFLEGLMKLLLRLTKSHPEGSLVICLNQLAMYLSTTHYVVMTALSMLSRLGWAAVTVLAEEDTVKIQPLPDQMSTEQALHEFIEYRAFRTALQEVHQFREWLMTAPLQVIKSSVALEAMSGTYRVNQEREHHAINVR